MSDNIKPAKNVQEAVDSLDNHFFFNYGYTFYALLSKLSPEEKLEFFNSPEYLAQLRHAKMKKPDVVMDAVLKYTLDLMEPQQACDYLLKPDAQYFLINTPDPHKNGFAFSLLKPEFYKEFFDSEAVQYNIDYYLNLDPSDEWHRGDGDVTVRLQPKGLLTWHIEHAPFDAMMMYLHDARIQEAYLQLSKEDSSTAASHLNSIVSHMDRASDEIPKGQIPRIEITAEQQERKKAFLDTDFVKSIIENYIADYGVEAIEHNTELQGVSIVIPPNTPYETEPKPSAM